MSFCFAFITNGENDDFLRLGIDSIRARDLSDYEILIVGNSQIKDLDVRVIPFDETQKHAWITRKKNLVAEVSTKAILIIMHDYFALAADWKVGDFQAMADQNWDVAVTPILNPDGSRYRDWVLWPFSHKFLRLPFIYTLGNLLPYHVKDLTDFMYINGSLMIVKRKFLLQNPLDENRTWGQGEDVEWSIRLRKNWKLAFFPKPTFHSLKPKDSAFHQIDPFSLLFIRIYAFVLRNIHTGIAKWMEIPY